MNHANLAADLAEKTGEAAKSGPIGLAVILVLCIAFYFLVKSMSKHLRKVREEFPTGSAESVPTPSVTDQAPSADEPRAEATQTVESPDGGPAPG